MSKLISGINTKPLMAKEKALSRAAEYYPVKINQELEELIRNLKH